MANDSNKKSLTRTRESIFQGSSRELIVEGILQKGRTKGAIIREIGIFLGVYIAVNISKFLLFASAFDVRLNAFTINLTSGS